MEHILSVEEPMLSGKLGLEASVDLVPEQTIHQMAQRHRARVAVVRAEGQPFVDLDIPFVRDMADW